MWGCRGFRAKGSAAHHRPVSFCTFPVATLAQAMFGILVPTRGPGYRAPSLALQPMCVWVCMSGTIRFATTHRR